MAVDDVLARVPSFGSKSIRELEQILAGEKQKGTKNSGLDPAAARAGIGPVNSSAKKPEDRRLAAGGIASPVVEGITGFPATVQRTYWPVTTVLSSDGILAFEYEAVNVIQFLDDTGALVEFQFQQEP
jgi:hypothetical protein